MWRRLSKYKNYFILYLTVNTSLFIFLEFRLFNIHTQKQVIINAGYKTKLTSTKQCGLHTRKFKVYATARFELL